MPDSIQFHVRIRYVTLLICGLLSALGVSAFICFSPAPVKPELIFQIVAACIALTAVIYTAMNVQLISQQQQRDLVHKRKIAAAELITQWHNPEMAKLTTIGAALRKEIVHLEPREVLELLSKDRDKHQAMVSILNYLEKMAILLEHDMADEKVLRDFFEAIVRVYYHALKAFIAEQRRVMNTDKIFDRFEALAKRWE